MSSTLQRVLLAVFVVVDVVLVVGAVRHVNGTPDSTEPDASATAPAATATTSTPSAPASTETPAQLPYDVDPASSVVLSAANDGAIVYGTRGNCGDSNTTVQVSTDDGATFTPSQTGLTTTLAVKADSADSITVVGTSSDCDVRQLTSTDGGRSWSRDSSIDVWYPNPRNASRIVSPRRSSDPGEGCAVTSLSQVTAESARVSCADGSFMGTGDSGKTWVRLGRLDNVRVSAFLTPSAGFALARYNGCAANAFTTTDGGVTWAPGGCITGEPAQAIAATSSRLFAVVDADTYDSADNGTTWMQP